MRPCRLITSLGALLFQILAFFVYAATGQIRQPNSSPSFKQGIVVEWLTKNSQAEKAGVRPGDVLLSWTRGDAKGKIESPFDLPYLRFEQASRGKVRVEGQRGQIRRIWLFGSETWGIAARPNFQGQVLTIYRDGQDLANSGNFSQAAERWRTAAFQEIDSRPSWLGPWFLSRIAQILFDAQQWNGSDDAYREALVQADAAGPIVRGELLRQWASGFDYRNDLTHAEKYYEEAVAEWHKSGAKTMMAAHLLLELGVVALNRGDLVKAEGCFLQALGVVEQLAPSGSHAAVTLANLGVLSEDRGDLEKAEGYYRRALAIEEQYLPRSHDLAQTLANLGTLADQRGDPARAEAYYRKALKIARGLEPNSFEVALILAHLGRGALFLGDTASAEAYQQQALSIREKLSPHSLFVAASLADLGRIYRARGDFTQADDYYRRALSIGEQLIPPPLEVAGFLLGYGNLLRDKNSFVKAEECYRRALEIMEKTTPESLDHADTLAALAGILAKKGEPDVAIQLYRQALDAFESKTTHLGGVERDLSRYRSKQASYYKEYVGVLLDQGQQELAFQVLEGSRARTLLESLARSNFDVRRGVDSALLDRERTLQQAINARSQYRIRYLTRKPADGQLGVMDADFAQLREKYQELEMAIRTNNPTYSALTHPQPLRARAIRDLLDDDSILLEYSLDENCSYVWAVTKSSIAVYSLPKRTEIETRARRVYNLLTARSRSTSIKIKAEVSLEARWAKADAEYRKAAAELSRMVLGPVISLLEGKRLLVVSEGALQYIPFSALPVPGTGEPLMIEHEIVNLPSASVVAELRRVAKGRKEAPRAVAVLADPVFDSSDERVLNHGGIGNSSHSQPTSSKLPEPRLTARARFTGRLSRSAADVGLNKNESYLNRLLYTRQEAEAIMAVIPRGKGMKVLDFKANRAMALSAKLAQYRVVHFATHGLLDSKNPDLSGLVLSMVDQDGKPQDGFLTLEDIYNLNLPVELVVLSACETGLGEDINGEGLIGLTRGFMYAGASRVVASLWNVSDEATSELMSRFYKAMEHDKLRPAAALRAAQLQMWRHRQWKSPYYWAAFQLQGEWK